MTMGKEAVYFPSAERWTRDAPAWAKSRRDEILAALREWCGARIPLVVDDAAWIGADAHKAST